MSQMSFLEMSLHVLYNMLFLDQIPNHKC